MVVRIPARKKDLLIRQIDHIVILGAAGDHPVEREGMVVRIPAEKWISRPRQRVTNPFLGLSFFCTVVRHFSERWK
jgi:hypothetical protein